MAIHKTTVVVCDKCNTERKIQRYVVQFPDGRRTVDLCQADYERLSLQDIYELFKDTPKKGRPVRGERVVSEAEITRARKRTAAKKTTAARKRAVKKA